MFQLRMRRAKRTRSLMLRLRFTPYFLSFFVLFFGGVESSWNVQSYDGWAVERSRDSRGSVRFQRHHQRVSLINENRINYLGNRLVRVARGTVLPLASHSYAFNQLPSAFPSLKVSSSPRTVYTSYETSMLSIVITLSIAVAAFASAESILMTEVFVIPIRPETFDWRDNGRYDQFSYQPSLLNAPDLPSWIHYTYSKRDHHGFLYGVAPRNQKYFQLEIVGLNKYTYETRYKVLDMNVLEKENLTKYEVHLKIDNLNVEDMFNRNRTEQLLDIFRKKLWTDASDLYATFLASAIELGARLPLKPSEGEGVVIRLGSSMPFSQELNELQEEVKPLWKLPSCPRDFKRTSVERLFRESGFALDWCSFRLVEQEQQSLQHESARRGPSMNVVGLSAAGISEHTEWRWARPTKASVPTRSYFNEIVTTIFVPTILLLVLAALLSTVLCLNHDKMEKRESPPGEGVGNNNIQMVQYATIERGTLKSLSAQPSSPNDSLLRSPRTSNERCNPYIRPNPPPYTAPTNLIGIRADF